MSSTYEQIKKLAKETGESCRDLIVLAPQNDPFYAGTKTNRLQAEWFATLWKRFGYGSGTHLRRIHYQLVSVGDFQKPNGLPYQNTENDWALLGQAAKQARYLGLVSPISFVDRRNPHPHIYYNGEDVDREPRYEVNPIDWRIPGMLPPRELELEGPTAEISGYQYSDSEQPYHVELWAEKSTMDDILLPIGEEYAVNVVTSLGFQSITSIIAMARRVAEIGKPVRIFYISDFDPAGDSMPVAVARQVEYWLATYAKGIEVRLDPIVLTAEQAEEYQLPRTPIKENDRRRGHFEQQHGEGATELDALEALHPGELHRIITEAIEPYRDTELEDGMSDAENEAQEAVDDALTEVWGKYEEDINALAERYAEIITSHYADFEKADAELEPIREQLEEYRQSITENIEALHIDLPGRPEADCAGDDGAEWLFDSERSYGEQLGVYKARKDTRDAS